MRKIALLFLVLSLAPRTAPAATLADVQIGFTAVRTLVIDGRRWVGKIWAMPGKERHEQMIEGYDPIFLLRADNPLCEAIVPKLKTIVEFVMPPALRLLGHDARKKPVGRDTVNGIATTRYAIDESVPEGRAEGLLWLSRDGIPMKLEGTLTGRKGKVAKVRWELSHVRIGPQPAALFEPPHGFSKLPAAAVMPLLGLKLKSGHK